MSITFAPLVPTESGTLFFGCPTDHYYCDPGCEDFYLYRYCDCIDARRAACEACSVQVNMSNANAALVIERLGLPFDYAGSIAAEDLLARAMLGNIGRDDSGVGEAVERGAGGATMVDCGVRPGYFADRLGALADLAAFAIERGWGIAWG